MMAKVKRGSMVERCVHSMGLDGAGIGEQV